MAVYEIIEKKLYKEKHQNIEAYFKEYWNISRAQGKLSNDDDHDGDDDDDTI